MDTVLESANDPGMVDKALKASATVTANSDQMPFSNQVEERTFVSTRFRLSRGLGKRRWNHRESRFESQGHGHG